MIPQVNVAFRSWFSTVEMKIVRSTPVNFEPNVEVLNILCVDMMLNAMSPQKVDRKAEGLRDWKWWEGWSEKKISPDTVLQDPNGVQFRVQKVTDWSQAGYYEYELTEQPNGLP